MGISQAFDDVGRGIGVGGTVHDGSHRLRQDPRFRHVMLSLNLHILEVRPERAFIPEGMTQIYKFHLSHGNSPPRSL